MNAYYRKMAHNLFLVIFWRGPEMPKPSFDVCLGVVLGLALLACWNQSLNIQEFLEPILKPSVA